MRNAQSHSMAAGLISAMALTLTVTLLAVSLILAGETPTTGESEIIESKHDTQLPRTTFAEGQMVVKVNQVSFPADSLALEMDGSVAKHLQAIDVYLFNVDPAQNLDSMAGELESAPDIAYAHPNYLVSRLHPVQGSYPFSDENNIGSYADQPAAGMLSLDGAHQSVTGNAVTVGIIDGGIDFTHPALNGMATSGYDILDDDADAFDEPGGYNSGHGTFVAGVVHLVAPDADLLAYRVTDADGYGTGFDLAEAIERAVNEGCQIINLSLVLLQEHYAVRDAIDYAMSQGVMVIVAAGNEGSEDPVYPAIYDNALAVAAIDSLMLLADFSSFGDHIDICAPGTEIYSAFQDDIYAWWSGTSFSTPFIAGLSALILEARPVADPFMIRHAMTQGADDLDGLNPDVAGKLGSGLADPLQSLIEINLIETATVSPKTLHFEVDLGSEYLVFPSATATINSSNAPASYTATVTENNPLFAYVVDSTGVTDDSVTISVDPYAAPVGTYGNTVQFLVDGCLEPVELTVYLTVSDSGNTPPMATINPSTMDFSAPAYSEILLYGSALLWSSNAPATFAGEVLDGGSGFTTLVDSFGVTNDSVTIAIDPSLMPGPGFYVDKVVYYVDSVLDPVMLNVYLTLSDTGAVPDSAWIVHDSSQYFHMIEGSSAVLQGCFHVISSNAPANFFIEPVGTPTFATLLDSGGTTNSLICFEVSGQTLPVGDYIDTVQAWVDGVVNNPVMTEIYLAVGPDTGSETATVWPTSFNYNASAGSTVTYYGNVTITSTNAPANYTVSILDAPDMVTVIDSAGMTDDSALFRIDSDSSFAPGLYIDTLLIEVDGVDNSPLISVVSLTVDTSGGSTEDTMAVWSPLYSYFVPAGSTVTFYENLVITSTNAPANYLVSLLDTPDVVTLLDSIGMTNDSVRFRVDNDPAFPPGLYADTLLIEVEGVNNSPQLTVIHIHVDSVGQAFGEVWPVAFQYSVPAGSTVTFYNALDITSTNAPANYTAAVLDIPDMVTLLDSAGQTNDSMVFRVDVDSTFAPGLYKDTIVIEIDGIGNNPLISIVYLTVDSSSGGSGNSAFAYPAYLDFIVSVGASDTLSGMVWLTSTNAPANYSGFVLGGPFSFVSLPDSAGFTDDSVFIVVDPSGLSVGEYYDSVVFDVFGVDYSVLVTVNLSVGGMDSMQVTSLTNYPNPFNPSTNIEFALEQGSDVHLSVYNIVGQHVVTLVDEYLPAGRHGTTWNGATASGYPVTSGIYFYRLQTEDHTLTRKMMLLK